MVLRAFGETCGNTRCTTPLCLSEFVVLVAGCELSDAELWGACVDCTSVEGFDGFGLAIKKNATATNAANPSQ